MADEQQPLADRRSAFVRQQEMDDSVREGVPAQLAGRFFRAQREHQPDVSAQVRDQEQGVRPNGFGGLLHIVKDSPVAESHLESQSVATYFGQRKTFDDAFLRPGFGGVSLPGFRSQHQRTHAVVFGGERR